MKYQLNPAFRKLPNESELPEPYNIDEVTRLIQAVHSVACDDKKFIYDTVLITVLEDVAPLIELYDLIPRILAGDHFAESKFQRILSENSSANGIKAYEGRVERSMQNILNNTIPDPSRGGGFCPPSFFIKPNTINLIQQTAFFISGSDEEKYVANLAAIDGIRERSICPDVFNFLAHQDQLEGTTRLLDSIEKIAKTNEFSGRKEELKELRREVNGGYDGLTQPPFGEGEPWLPPVSRVDRPIRGCGPDDGPVPDSPVFPEKCDLIREYCKDLIRGSAKGFRLLPDSIVSANIENIRATNNNACVGDLVTIEGSGFGASQEDFEVVFGIQVAQVVSWSDTEIIVRIPPNASGCIGIRNEKLEEQRREAHETNQNSLDQFIEGTTGCFGLPTDVQKLPYRPDTPKCHDFNFLQIGSPIIDFRVNNGWNITIEAGDDIVLKWSVENADTMEIIRIGANGPMANITNTMSGQKNLMAFSASSEISATYELRATNRCGIVSRRVTVKAIRTPALEVLGIEVTQAIQRFNWNNPPSQNNTVALVSEKLTMVRVHVTSGVTDGFDFGVGQNILPRVRGTIKLTYPSGFITHVDDILNPGQEINAQPLTSVDRGVLDHSLNFELPINNLDGVIQIEATIFTEPIGGVGRRDLASISTTFEKQWAFKRIGVILVNDTINGNPAPTMSDFYQILQGTRTRYPISEKGFKVYRLKNHKTINTQIRNYTINTGSTTRTVQVSEDLSVSSGWSNLLSRIDDIADDYNGQFFENETIWVGLVPNSNSTTNGIAYSGNFWWFNRAMLSKPLKATFAHELAHTQEILHARSNNGPSSTNCGNPTSIDGSLAALTEDIGIDVAAYRLMPQGIPTLMTYCWPSFTMDYQDRWVSIDLWNRLNIKI